MRLASRYDRRMVDGARARAPELRVIRGGAAPGDAPRPAPPPALDDVELVEACRRADPSAARALHDRARPIVDATIARLLGRKDSRFEDLAQIAMIELVGSMPRFRGECSLDTWTSRVAARAVYKELRRRKIEGRIFDVSGGDEAAAGADAGSRIEARSALARVRAHLAALDPVKAWTVVLHDVGGYDLKEISEITDASVAAAQSRLVRGRAELERRLSADPELADWLRRGSR